MVKKSKRLAYIPMPSLEDESMTPIFSKKEEIQFNFTDAVN